MLPSLIPERFSLMMNPQKLDSKATPGGSSLSWGGLSIQKPLYCEFRSLLERFFLNYHF